MKNDVRISLSTSKIMSLQIIGTTVKGKEYGGGKICIKDDKLIIEGYGQASELLIIKTVKDNIFTCSDSYTIPYEPIINAKVMLDYTWKRLIKTNSHNRTYLFLQHIFSYKHISILETLKHIK